jgi:hypothetical protein
MIYLWFSSAKCKEGPTHDLVLMSQLYFVAFGQLPICLLISQLDFKEQASVLCSPRWL